MIKRILLLLAIVIFTFGYAYADLEIDAECKITKGGIGFKEIYEIMDFSNKARTTPNPARLTKYMEQLEKRGVLGMIPEGTKVKILEIHTPDRPISSKSKSFVKAHAEENDSIFWTFDVLLDCE